MLLTNYLPTIKSPDDLKQLDDTQKVQLCEEIRDCLIKTVSKNGGHLASNLGVVELTVAIHSVFNSPTDSVLFDVGHQSYVHKLLTGRYDRFDTLRTYGGLSGFMRPDESEHDPVISGHSSCAISSAVGIAAAKKLDGDESYTVTVIGDGAMTGGMAFEGLNNSSQNSRMIVILNDNKMSISKNVGAFARYLSIIRSRPSYHRFKHRLERVLIHIPFVGKKLRNNLLRSKNALKNAIYHSNVFEDLGFHYFGPIDGHDLKKLENVLQIAKSEKRPALIHVLTQKGKGYLNAEKTPQDYHGVKPFNIDEGGNFVDCADFSHIAGDELCKLAAANQNICAVTAAMEKGTGLENFAKRYKNRFFDVGIAEQHAVTFCAGLASRGKIPFFAVYSSFLQRAYDQLIHDVAIANLPVNLLVDRAGLVGADGDTHNGVFDIPILKSVPNSVIYAPSTNKELRYFIKQAAEHKGGLFAIRYEKGSEVQNIYNDFEPCDYYLLGNKNSDILIITFGALSNFIEPILNSAAVLKLNKIYPLSNEVFDIISTYKQIHIFEESIKSGGIGEYIAANVSCDVIIHAIDNTFVPCGSTSQLREIYGLSELDIKKAAKVCD
ncbi:MAG: 1-deoxy-D-xylulose-5-phosphate synthase [Oscillospiraceae bacterium]|nr:1-deoxy-D-xylulose-5-phosphate synthase [Candidatus Equicaccousia limihippi]